MTDQPRSVAPVVALFETYGSGATQIGARVAEALGVPSSVSVSPRRKSRPGR